MKNMKSITTIHAYIAIFKEESDSIKKNQMKILELKSTITEMKNSPQRLNSRNKMAEESINLKEY